MPYAPEYLHLVIPGVRFEAWLYGRNSDDATKDGRSVEDQLITGRSLCDRYNWPIVEEFKDSGISASRHATKSRKGFEELLETILTTPKRDGVVHILVAFEASRYYRDLEAYVRLRNACLHAGVLLCYNGQVYDLSRRDDRKTTAQHAVDAEDEAEGIQGRNKRTTTLHAETGHPHGKLVYGYAREYAVVGGRQRCARQYEHPVTGKYVLAAFQHIDSGNSLRSLVRWLRSQPDAARHDSAPWTEDLARRMLLNRAYLGERLHLGTYRKGTWDPIKGLDTPAGRAMFNRVVATLTAPDRRTQRGSEVSHLLSLIALCGECGDHARLTARNSTRSGRPTLLCQERQNTGVSEDLLDALVEESVIAWFEDKAKARAALVPDDEQMEAKVASAQRLINGYEEQLREARQLAEEFEEEAGRFKLSAASLSRMEQKLVPKLEQEQARLQHLTGVSPLLLSLLDSADPQAVWDGLTLEQKRETIRKVVTVRLYKARKQGVRKLEPGRVSLSFLGEPGFRARPLRVHGSVSAPAAVPPAGAGTG